MVRLKVRYVLFEILYPTKTTQQIQSKQLMNALRSSIENYFGELGTGECQSTLGLRHFNPSTSSGIIRIGRSQAPIVQGALTYIKELNNVPVVIRVTHVSGTIKKCEKQALKIRRKEIDEVNKKQINK